MIRSDLLHGIWIGASAALLCFTTTACDSAPKCGAAPPKPAAIRTPTFFGPIVRDNQDWTHARPGSTDAAMTVGTRTFATDVHTERLGSCAPRVRATECAAFVGLRRSGTAAWVMRASPVATDDSTHQDQLQIGSFVWKAGSDSLVLSRGGVELPYSRAFVDKLHRYDGLRANLQGRQVGTTVYVDAKSGDVTDAFVGGCA